MGPYHMRVSWRLWCGVKKLDRGRSRAVLPRRLGVGQTAPVLVFLLYRILCGLLRILVRVGVDDRDLEIAVLRHQVRILRRRGRRPRYRTADRALLAAASRFLPESAGPPFRSCPTRSTGGAGSS